MNDNAELLNCIYQNAKMGSEAINTLINKVDDNTMKSDLVTQYNQYKNMASTAEGMLTRFNERPSEANKFKKAVTDMSINFSSAMDDSTSHLAQMMIEGSNMGIIDMQKKLNEYTDVDPDVKNLAMSLNDFERQSIDQLKKYL